MQTRALQKIGVWRRAALSVAVVGVLLTYTGFVSEVNILIGVFDIVVTVLGGRELSKRWLPVIFLIFRQEILNRNIASKNKVTVIK